VALAAATTKPGFATEIKAQGDKASDGEESDQT
jgi:hypothetical protein